MKKILLSSIIIGSSLLIGNSFTYADKLKVKPEIFQPTHTKSSETRVKLRSVQAGIKDLSAAKKVGLPVLSSEEIAKIKPAGKKRPIQIGINRSLSSLFSGAINLAKLDWKETNGGRAAHIIITSEQAESLRLQIKVTKIPDGAEIRFFSPSQLEQSVTVFTAEKIRNMGLSFWSPSVNGDQIGLEIYLPKTAKFSELEITIPEVSHIFQDISKPLSQSKIPSLRAASESCNIDIACATQDWQDTGKSVAKYIYVETDGAYLCSGTLLADSDSNTQIPYFLTANHCINNSNAAQSMELHWFYRAEQCGGTTTSANFQTTQGGAELLNHSADTDFSFLKLNNTPPAGVGLSGWSIAPLQANDTVVGLHHPGGDVKKYSKGQFGHFEKIVDLGTYLSVTQDPNGNFISVTWSEGITAGGSSGSGLWRTEQGVNYLVGALFGGSSFCADPQAPDDYGRFDRSYPAISQWLNPAPNNINIDVTTADSTAIGLKDGVLIARYIQGLRGAALTAGIAESENIANLEAKLAAINSHLDIDLDGNVTAEQDAMLIIRYMLGLQGNALTSGILSAGATRTNPAEIKQYLDGFLQTRAAS